ncbi:Copper Transporter integral membrane protein that functions in high affinity copper transport [Aspergillus wentii]|nr:Copper Transporter integral membrane protein that functions in high affinity copper transport [Aspergillus wentii]
MDMDMGTMTGMSTMTGMTMTASSTASSALSSSTSSMDMGGMDMGGMDMGGMDMGMGGCQVSMLWNWNTIDACFLSKSWHITSRGMFAGSCIGVICLVLALEFLRRLGREYDAFIVHRARLRRQYLSTPSPKIIPTTTSSPDSEEENPNPASCCANDNGDKGATAAPVAKPTPTPLPATATVTDDTPFRPSIIEQFIRALLHMLQFAVAYFVMLLAMYFNGYIIICIFIGAFLGSFIFSWEPINLGKENDALAVTKCCG